MTGSAGRAGPLLALAAAAAAALLGPAPLLLAALGGALLAWLPGASWGGPGLTLWGLAGLAVAAALQGGLGGLFAPGGLYRSPWLLAHPPGRTGRALAAGLGTWAGLGVLLLPALLLPLWPWQRHAGELRAPIPVGSMRFDPGPLGLLDRPGAAVCLRPQGTRPVARIRLVAFVAPGPGETLEPAALELSLDGGPFESAGRVHAPGRDLALRLEPPRAFGSATLRRGPEPGARLWLEPESVRLLGAARPPGEVWLCLWLGAWNLATAGALTLAAAGAVLSRPTALCLGAAWAFLALADGSFRAGLPPQGPAQGEACGFDLGMGLGWLPLGWAGLAVLVLARLGGRDPDQEGR